MNKTNFLSTILVVVFMISCLSFFNAGATEEPSVNVDTPSAVQTTPEATTSVQTVPEETTPVTESTAPPTESTTYATVADPVYTQATSKTEKTTPSNNTSASLTYYENYIDNTKETKEIKTTKATEPTTPKKNITNYGSKFRPLKWISLILMIGSAVALVFVNVRYKKIHGKPSKKPTKLDTSAKFTNKPKHESETIDLSSFSKKNTTNDENKLKNDDDLYI